MIRKPRCVPVPELFHNAEDKHVAAKICRQCPLADGCLRDALRERVREQTRGGVWFPEYGPPEVIDVTETHQKSVGLAADEVGLERRLLNRYGDFAVKTRHEVWVAGEQCQRQSRKRGIPCEDPVCRAIRNGIVRQRREAAEAS